MVTHNLDILPFATTVVVMEDGQVVQQGPYTELLHADGIFSKLIKEFGKLKQKKPLRKDEVGEMLDPKFKTGKDTTAPPVMPVGQEERFTGSVSWKAYRQYVMAAGGVPVGLILAATLSIKQVLKVGIFIWLGLWSGNTLESFSQNKYMVSQ
jgi:ABC-type glutathione transport system ATPase component